VISRVGERYRLEERIGGGGAGEVWRAVDERLDRPVAVKLLHAHLTPDGPARDRFRREALAMARLQHPHIVQLLDFSDEDADRPYLVEEFCAGGALTTLVALAPIEWAELRDHARHISEALAHAHAAGVVHRDLKPANVLFTGDARLVVADFGLARLVAWSEPSITATGVRMGSPEYWSPEQAAGEPVSERADMYALGCMLYELATGVLPYPGEDRLAAGYRRVREQPPRPSSVHPGIDPAAEALILRLLRREPAVRPRAVDVVAELGGRPAPPVTEAFTAPTIADVDPTVVPTPPPPPPPAEEPRATQPPPPPPVSPLGEPSPPRSGVRIVGAVIAFFLGLAAIGVARVADTQTDAVDLDRTGLVTSGRLSSDDATYALVMLGAAAVLTLAVLVLAIWAARSSGRARSAFMRGLLGVVSVLLAGGAAAALVWTAHAAATADLRSLWDLAVHNT
jgi:eukaryotic-like serine/threonine-protein kinase